MNNRNESSLSSWCSWFCGNRSEALLNPEELDPATKVQFDRYKAAIKLLKNQISQTNSLRRLPWFVFSFSYAVTAIIFARNENAEDPTYDKSMARAAGIATGLLGLGGTIWSCCVKPSPPEQQMLSNPVFDFQPVLNLAENLELDLDSTSLTTALRTFETNQRQLLLPPDLEEAKGAHLLARPD